MGYSTMRVEDWTKTSEGNEMESVGDSSPDSRPRLCTAPDPLQPSYRAVSEVNSESLRSLATASSLPRSLSRSLALSRPRAPSLVLDLAHAHARWSLCLRVCGREGREKYTRHKRAGRRIETSSALREIELCLAPVGEVKDYLLTFSDIETSKYGEVRKVRSAGQ